MGKEMENAYMPLLCVIAGVYCVLERNNALVSCNRLLIKSHACVNAPEISLWCYGVMQLRLDHDVASMTASMNSGDLHIKI